MAKEFFVGISLNESKFSFPGSTITIKPEEFSVIHPINMSSYSQDSNGDGSGFQYQRELKEHADKYAKRLAEIYEKYNHDFEGIADEIDIMTGEILTDNGHLGQMPDVDIEAHGWGISEHQSLPTLHKESAAQGQLKRKRGVEILLDGRGYISEIDELSIDCITTAAPVDSKLVETRGGAGTTTPIQDQRPTNTIKRKRRKKKGMLFTSVRYRKHAH